MTIARSRDLEELSHSGLELADRTEDLRGRRASDRTGSPVGVVEDLMIDPQERRVRMFDVVTSGVLGLGKKHHLVPFELVTGRDDANVSIDRDADHIAGGPEFKPGQDDEMELHYAEVYAWFGVKPYWEIEGIAEPTIIGQE